MRALLAAAAALLLLGGCGSQQEAATTARVTEAEVTETAAATEGMTTELETVTESNTATTEETMTGRETGAVKWFSDEKGYGFITADSDGRDVFVHYSDVESYVPGSIDEGARVSFEIEQGPKGLQAKDVR